MRYARAAIFLVPTLAFLAACGGTTAQGPSGSGDGTDRTTPVEETSSTEGSTSTGPVEVNTTTIVTGLEVPWDLVFTPDGNAMVTERDSGRLSSVDPSGNVKELQRLPEGGTGEGGLLGLALSPDYKNDGLVYAYYTTNEDNRVVRFRLGEDPQPILAGIPNNSYHDGGRIAFGPDGMLYV